jgi:hypothetical protein
MLHFEGAWRFDSPGSIPDGVVRGFSDLIGKIAAQGGRKQVLERFKSHFARGVGTTHYVSSNESWAESDLAQLMEQAADNAPVFIEAFYDACEALRARSPGMVLRMLGV